MAGVTLQSISFESLDDPSYHREMGARYELMHKHLLKSMSAYAIVLSILLASSYSCFLQFPKPLSSTSTSSSDSSVWQKLFIYFNSFSLFASVVGLLLFSSSSFSPLLALDLASASAETKLQRRIELLAATLPKFLYVIFFFGVSLSCCVLAYVFAGLATVASTASEQRSVLIPAAVGGFIYLQALLVCGRDAWQLICGSIRQNKELWDAVKKRTSFGYWLDRYLDFLSTQRHQHQQNTGRVTSFSLSDNHTLPCQDTGSA